MSLLASWHMVSSRFFVTGGSGWIGSAAVPELLAAGHRVVALARSDGSAAGLERAGAEVVRGSLDDLDLLQATAAAGDGVLHLAFKHDLAFTGDYAGAVAADGAAIAAFGDALAGSGRPLVIASGLAGHAPGAVVDETTVPEPTSAAAARTASERTVLALADRDVRGISVRFAPTVHGEGDPGFVATLVQVAREQGVAGHLDGPSRWPAVHRDDAARLLRLALESAPAGAVLHAVAEEGVPLRDVAAALGQRLRLPTAAVAPEHFGWLAPFVGIDVRASSARTRALLGWDPAGPTLLQDLAAGRYG